MGAAPGSLELPSETDEQLVARFQAGDEAAFDALVVRHRAAIYCLAHRLTGRHEDADDLAQEAFLRAYRGLHRFRGESRFRTWMTRILVNLAINSRRARRATVPLEEAAGQTAVTGEGPETTLRRQVRQAVRRLPRRQRQILMLKVYEEMKFIEIADVTGISVGTAKATFFQAVQGLRRRLLIRRLARRSEEVEA
jgi:RNA polymerase sigma-70 factor (ECF subfamily)